MKGKELVDWIQENNAENHVVIANTKDHRYLRAVGVWEGESDGGAIMIDVVEEGEEGEVGSVTEVK